MRIGTVVASLLVAGLDLEIPGGEFFTLLGPSGCGKTTTLRLIAGFERPDAGRIVLDGTDVSKVPPHKRRVNTVFQSYALFPNRTVAENIAFGLKYRKLSKPEAAQKVTEAIELVRLDEFRDRRPGLLSGGQQQRVALARALVLEPPVLLLDEPLGALDARLRLDLQVELKRIQEQVGITFVYVTHDQDEALTMSDRVAVMREGSVEQCDVPRAIYERPATAFVANFLGSSNLMDAEIKDGAVQLGTFAIACAEADGQGPVTVMIRPENVHLEERGGEEANRIPGMVEEIVYLGFHQEVRVRLATGALVKADVPTDEGDAAWEPGAAVAVHLPASAIRVLDREAP